MLNNPELTKRKKFYLLAFAFSLAGAAIVLLILFFDIDQPNALLLSIWGLGSMCIAIIIVVSSSSHPEASIGVWFAVLLALQHGGGWILAQIFTEQHYSRHIFFTDITLAKSVAFAGTGLLAFSSAYAFYNSLRRKNNRDANCAAKTRNSAIDQIPWSILLFWGMGILVFEIAGGMPNVSGDTTIGYIYRSTFGYLSKIVIIIISLKLLSSRFKMSVIYLVLLVIWSGYIFLTGQRQYIIMICVTTVVLSYKWLLTTIRIRHILLLISFFLIIILGMAYLRENYGRASFTNLTGSEQILVLFSNPRTTELDTILEGLVYDLGYRLNAGNILLGKLAEQPVNQFIWIEPVTYSIAKLIPGFLWQSKQGLEAGELPRLISLHFGLPNGDYIATYITVFFAMGRLPMLVFFTALFGSIIAFLDLRFSQNNSLLSLIFAVGIGSALLTIDHSIEGLFLYIRDSLLLYFIIKFSILFKDMFGKSKNENNYWKTS